MSADPMPTEDEFAGYSFDNFARHAKEQGWTKVDRRALVEGLMDSLHDWQAEEGQTDETMITVALEAQMQATIHLAEQQTLHNKLAYSALYPDTDLARRLRAEIEAAL